MLILDYRKLMNQDKPQLFGDLLTSHLHLISNGLLFHFQLHGCRHLQLMNLKCPYISGDPTISDPILTKLLSTATTTSLTTSTASGTTTRLTTNPQQQRYLSNFDQISKVDFWDQLQHQQQNNKSNRN